MNKFEVHFKCENHDNLADSDHVSGELKAEGTKATHMKKLYKSLQEIGCLHCKGRFVETLRTET